MPRMTSSATFRRWRTAHRVAGCVHAVLEQTGGVADDVLDRLAAGRREAASHHLVVRGVLARVGAVLDAAGVPWLVFKGPVLSSSVYCDPGMRRYSDLDVLVPPDRFADAVVAMEAAGFGNPVTSWSPQVYFRAGAIAFNVGWISVDLHWHVMFKYQDRRWYHIDPEQLFARRRTVDVGGRPCATFDEVDTVFHLALHAVPRGVPSPRVAEGHRDGDRHRSAGSRRTGPPVARGEVRASHRHRPGPVEMDARGCGARRHRHRPRRVVSGRGSCGRSPRSTTSGRSSRRPSPGTLLTKHTRMSLPRTASWAVRRISDRRAEHQINRALREDFDPNSCVPEELARNQAERDTFFALVGDWRSELT